MGKLLQSRAVKAIAHPFRQRQRINALTKISGGLIPFQRIPLDAAALTADGKLSKMLKHSLTRAAPTVAGRKIFRSPAKTAFVSR